MAHFFLFQLNTQLCAVGLIVEFMNMFFTNEYDQSNVNV